MDHTYWHKQTPGEALYPDLLWSRPQHKKQAGKLLIVGGNAHGFAAAAEAYAEAGQAGIGTARVLLPDSLQKTVGRIFEAGEYAPSTPSGSFSQQALAELLDLASWSDGVLLAGDLGRNSETAIVLESFLAKYPGLLVLTGDAVDYFIKTPASLLERENTVLVLNFPQLQKLSTSIHFATAFTSQMDFLNLIKILREFTEQYQTAIVLRHNETVFVALGGLVSTTKTPAGTEVKLAAHAAVWQLQNPSKPFEAATTSLV
ncbi:hypothetical protein COY17_00590 [Candidatus Saccharibacteria bacterium CG_4_10_14_0_2_um_filter_52_9]|nr:MAG: hypothetical protein COY17_00590 [Candidatus Saccharibacteria bacterium CG_4_10_14_0_2_um_filter_52_9]